jgi:predicted lipoprotein with Yx(FWY)xxD motif
MRTAPFVAFMAAAGIVGLAACGGSKSATPSVNAPAATPSTAPAAAGQSVAVMANTTKLGPVLVGTDGRTLYGFTNDTEAKSTCYGACAQAWPPVIVQPDWQVGPGLDSGIFSTITRDDGSLQLVAGKWPVYEFSGDATPGDVNGQGSGDVWFAVGKDAKLLKAAAAKSAAPATTIGYGSQSPASTTAAPAPATPAPAPPVAAPAIKLADSPLGRIVVAADGRTLYGFTPDSGGMPTCVGACAQAWPPAAASGTPTADGVIAPVSTVTRPDGSSQLKVGKWPAYFFAGDAAPGDVNGQGSAGKWFVIGADGKLLKG